MFYWLMLFAIPKIKDQGLKQPLLPPSSRPVTMNPEEAFISQIINKAVPNDNQLFISVLSGKGTERKYVIQFLNDKLILYMATSPIKVSSFSIVEQDRPWYFKSTEFRDDQNMLQFNIRSSLDTALNSIRVDMARLPVSEFTIHFLYGRQIMKTIVERGRPLNNELLRTNVKLVFTKQKQHQVTDEDTHYFQ
eukprot:NODE_647_length_5045_cov_0.419733.p3 type:complete len:192 gc:universal NODE_647_length_5045_cov_0.419733:4843-4268(-)